MVCGVCDAPHHDPRTAARRVEERDVPFPPPSVFLPELSESFPGVLGVASDEGQAGLLLPRRRRAHVDLEHAREPLVLAQTLMNHVLAERPVTPEVGMRSDVKVRVV